jgi:hypothetical protein
MTCGSRVEVANEVTGQAGAGARTDFSLVGIAVDATSVYWTNGAVMTVPLGGGTSTTLASGQQPSTMDGISGRVQRRGKNVAERAPRAALG